MLRRDDRLGKIGRESHIIGRIAHLFRCCRRANVQEQGSRGLIERLGVEVVVGVNLAECHTKAGEGWTASASFLHGFTVSEAN